MKNYVTILKEALPGITPEDMNMPFSDSGIHSLDSVILRGTLESHFGFEIPDSDWYGFGTLSETLQYCNHKKSLLNKKELPGTKVSVSREQEINMPKMANAALSENWLLKEMGDMHWELLTKGLGQKSSEFTDNLGNRLYAAFVRIKYSISPLNHFGENERLQMDSKMHRFGNYAYYSDVNGCCNDKTINATMMTSFSARKCNDNARISRSAPDEKINHVPELEATPDFYTEHRLIKKGLIDRIESGGYDFNIADKEMELIEHTINPFYEVNGVGLLYFAAYPIIADRCASEFFKHTMELKDYDKTYHTIFRDTFYFANCNTDDKIIVKLNSAELLEGNKIKMATSLYRQSDNKLMARVFTVKQK